MIATDAIRYLHHEAADCRGRDSSEALCLLLPFILRQLALPPMDDIEARAFACELKEALRNDLRTAA